MNEQIESMSGFNYTIPAPHLMDIEAVSNSLTYVQKNIIDVRRFSCFAAQGIVLKYIIRVKLRGNKRLSWQLPVDTDDNLYKKTWNPIMQHDQILHYHDMAESFRKKKYSKKYRPSYHISFELVHG